MCGEGDVQLSVVPEEIRRECQIFRAGVTGDSDLSDSLEEWNTLFSPKSYFFHAPVILFLTTYLEEYIYC